MKQTIRLRESELKRMIAESVKRVLKEAYDPEEWEDVYMMNNNRDKIQSKGTGPNKKWRTIKNNQPKIANKFNKPYDPEEWEDAYKDNKGNIIQSRGTGPNKKWRTIKSKKY